MNDVIEVFNYLMNLASQILGLFMGSWITSIFIFGSIILFVLNLLFINQDDDK